MEKLYGELIKCMIKEIRNTTAKSRALMAHSRSRPSIVQVHPSLPEVVSSIIWELFLLGVSVVGWPIGRTG